MRNCPSALSLFTCLITTTFFFSTAANVSPKLVPEEVVALKQIAERLKKTDWDFTKDPCNGEGNWNFSDENHALLSIVACDCSFNDSSACHVVSIDLSFQNLTGVLPPEFANLTHLNHLNLGRNLLTGPVPLEWGSLKLSELILMGNRLTGPFPKIITSMITLQNLSIEGNYFTGPIPKDLGNLINLKRCFLSSNNLSGEFPPQIAQLVNMDSLVISDNSFSGKFPENFSNLSKLQKLHAQGSGFEGPIPSSIFSLTTLTDLRISDLEGKAPSILPSLKAMKSLKILILRNCQLEGNLPFVLGKPEKLKHLDLSFNKLTGNIPPGFELLNLSDFIYLTSNKLSGIVPQWLLQRGHRATDLSYNNFTLDDSNQATCPSDTANFVESFSNTKSKTAISFYCASRYRDFSCTKPKSLQRSSLYINCGGEQVGKFEADNSTRGVSSYTSFENWAMSSTGNFMDNDEAVDQYTVAADVSSLRNVSSTEAELYRSARVTPLAATYYGLCLLNGNYNVTLHFAEIVFTDDNTVSSLGRRIFDVYIQDELKLKGFNIANEAGGAGIPIKKTFNVNVDSNKIKILFYWAGKGTVGVPHRGIYGPLVSAISIDPNFDPKRVLRKHNFDVKIVVGVVCGVVLLSLLFVATLLYCKRLREKIEADKEFRGLDVKAGVFTLKQLKEATKNFDQANKLGEGGFGAVYKGLLSDGKTVAVKQLSTKSKQGNREFVNEVGVISSLQHPNLVKLYGCCVEGKQLMLVYEYMVNNCLSRALFGKDGAGKMKLDWPTRRRICIDVAKGLAYLHEESAIKVVHRDIKASNVLLDKNLNAKISDFGLAKLADDENSHISTRIAGTIGYMSPEYAMRGYLTAKADVYSFGVVAMEIVSGKCNTSYRSNGDSVYLLDWATSLHERGALTEMVDPSLGSQYSAKEVTVVLHVALLCTNASPSMRPAMSDVVGILEGTTDAHDFLLDLSLSSNTSKLRGGDVKKQFWEDACGSEPTTVSGLSNTTSSFVESGVSGLSMDAESAKDDGEV